MQRKSDIVNKIYIVLSHKQKKNNTHTQNTHKIIII